MSRTILSGREWCHRRRIFDGPVPVRIALVNPIALLDPGEPRAIEGWSEWLRGDVDTKIADLIRECTVTGRPCGDDMFVEQLEQLTGRNLRPKKPGPKPKVTDGALLAFGSDNPEFR